MSRIQLQEFATLANEPIEPIGDSGIIDDSGDWSGDWSGDIDPDNYDPDNPLTWDYSTFSYWEMLVMIDSGEWHGGYVNGIYYKPSTKPNNNGGGNSGGGNSGGGFSNWQSISLSGGDENFTSNLNIGNDNYPIPTIEPIDPLDLFTPTQLHVVTIIWNLYIEPQRPDEPPFEGNYEEIDEGSGDYTPNYYINYNTYVTQTLRFTGIVSIPSVENATLAFPYVGYYNIQEDGMFKVTCMLQSPNIVGVTYCGEIYVLREGELALHGPLLPHLFEQIPGMTSQDTILGGTYFYLPLTGNNIKVVLQIKQIRNNIITFSEDYLIYEL